MYMPQTRMPQTTAETQERIWVMGVEKKTLHTMLHPLPTGLEVEARPVNTLTSSLAKEQAPSLIFITLDAWSRMTREEREVATGYEESKLVLVLEEDVSSKGYDIEALVSQEFLCAVPMPLTLEKLNSCREKAREILSVYDDIYKMTNEILLERELLARKNEQLDFLNKILTKASKSLDPRTIIQQAGHDLNILIKVESIMGIFWDADAPNFLSAEIFTAPNLQDKERNEWVGYLMDQGERHARNAIKTYQIESLNQDKSVFQHIGLPDSGKMIQLPMILNDRTFGLLCIVSPEAHLLGRDKVKILQAVGNHLALAIRNALMYRRMQNQADHDGLTRIFNRQNFERRIVKELKRHQRYQNELSLLMLDLDHFKQINDEYGHLAGDLVLREVAGIIRSTLRECDFPARYGGEEFVAILPQTEEEAAWLLAERLRKKIAAHTFKFHEHYFQVTASIGISSVKPSMLKSAEYLVHMTDQALYRAKTSGRNMVCRSAPPVEEEVAVENIQQA